MNKYPFFKIKDGQEVTVRFLDAIEYEPPPYDHYMDMLFNKCPLCEAGIPQVRAPQYVSVDLLDPATGNPVGKVGINKKFLESIKSKFNSHKK